MHPLAPTLRRTAAAALALGATATAQFSFSTAVTTPNPFGTASSIKPMVANLNGDAFRDIVVAGASRTEIGIGSLIAPGTFTMSPVSGLSGGRAYAADLDGDGYDDLLVIADLSIEYVMNDGSGGFPGPVGTYAVTSIAVIHLVAADLDNDGAVELLVYKRIGGGSYACDVLDVTAGSPLPSLTEVASITIYSSGADIPCDVIDADGDGDLDIVTSLGRSIENTTTTAGVLSLTYPPTYTPYRQVFNGGGVVSGDFDGNGSQDALFTQTTGQYATPGLRLFLAETGCVRTTTWTSESRALPNVAVQDPHAADFDGDGRDDVMFRRNVGAVIHHFLLSVGLDQEFASTAFDALSSRSWAIPGDFDADGKPDILAVTATTFEVYRNTTRSGFAEQFFESPWMPPTVTPRYVWVDTARGDPSPDGSVEHPYPTIGAGVAAAVPGDVVLVRPGYYNCSKSEASSIVVDGIQLIGTGGPDATFVDETSFELRNDARLTGFTLRTNGTIAAHALVTVENGTVVGNVLLGGSPKYGIAVRQGAYTARIGSNVVHDFSSGVYIEYLNFVPGLPSVYIWNNTLVGNADGIEFGSANVLEIVNNLIVDQRHAGVNQNCTTQLNSLLVDYNWVWTPFGHDYQLTVPLPNPVCNAPFQVAPGPHDVRATFDMNAFVDAAGLDFHLDRTHVSTPLDLGSSSTSAVTWLSIDVDGDPRSVLDSTSAARVGLAPDIGADEITEQELSFGRDLGTWQFTTNCRSGTLETKLVTLSPGLLPNLGNSFLLLSPFTVIGSLPTGAGPTSVSAFPELTSPLGARVYLQSIVLDAATSRLTLTNPIVITIE